MWPCADISRKSAVYHNEFVRLCIMGCNFAKWLYFLDAFNKFYGVFMFLYLQFNYYTARMVRFDKNIKRMVKHFWYLFQTSSKKGAILEYFILSINSVMVHRLSSTIYTQTKYDLNAYFSGQFTLYLVHHFTTNLP